MRSPARFSRSVFLGAGTAILAACAGQSDPLSPSSNPNLAVFSAGEAELVICKTSATAGNFDYSWSIVSTGTSSVPLNVSGNVTGLAAGDCVLAATVPTTNGGRFRATVTEAALPANWSLTAIGASWSLGGISVVPVVDLGAQSISNVLLANDVGATVTFTNLYTPPPPPPGGCTLTLGYWKTHSEFGPAPYDATWAQLPSGASTGFFLSGQTWFQVFNTTPSGNAYYILAHQYMAAVLNGLNGASAPAAVTQAIASATALFNTYTPAQIGALKGNQAPRPAFISLAETLDDYNNGLIGPGHCN